MRILSNAYIQDGRYNRSGIIINLNVFSAMINIQLIDIKPSPFKTCVHLVLIKLSQMARDSLCATLKKLTIAHTFLMWKFSSLPDSGINTDHSFVTLLELPSANTEVPSRINAFCHVTVYAYREGISVRKLPVFPTRFTGLVTARNIFSFERLWKRITWRRTKNYLCVLLNRINYRIIEHHLSPASNKS